MGPSCILAGWVIFKLITWSWEAFTPGNTWLAGLSSSHGAWRVHRDDEAIFKSATPEYRFVPNPSHQSDLLANLNWSKAGSILIKDQNINTQKTIYEPLKKIRFQFYCGIGAGYFYLSLWISPTIKVCC